MKSTILGLAILFAGPIMAQTVTDDMKATENWWDAVGADFFSEATMQEPRPASEIRAQWTGLSADDQAAVRARCAAAAGDGSVVAPSLQEGSEDNTPDASATDLADGVLPGGVDPATGAVDPGLTAGETTTTGSVGGVEVQTASPSDTPAPDTGLAGGAEAEMVLICDLIAELN